MSKFRSGVISGLAALTAMGSLLPVRAQSGPGREVLSFPDASGEFRTYSRAGFIDLQNPFFQVLGTNGRACVTCHQPSDGWSITPAHLQARFATTGGLDPIFRTTMTAPIPPRPTTRPSQPDSVPAACS